jgi:hypothetical protein
VKSILGISLLILLFRSCRSTTLFNFAAWLPRCCPDLGYWLEVVGFYGAP